MGAAERIAGALLLAAALAPPSARAQVREGPALDPWQEAAERALTGACEVDDDSGGPYCAASQGLGRLTPDEAGAVLLSLSGKEITARKSTLLETAGDQQAFIGCRLSALRGGRAGLEALDPAGPGGGVFAAPEPAFAKVGVFTSALFGFGSRDESAREAGFDYDRMGGAWGADFRAAQSLLLGVAGGFTRSRHAFDRTDGRLAADAYNVSGYAGVYPTEALRLEGIATYGWTRYETLRRAIDPGPPAGVLRAEGDSSGRYVALSAEAGYDFALGGLLFGPYGRVSYLDAALGSYTERGAGAFDLRVAGLGVYSLKSAVGAEASYAVSTSFGVLLPHVRFDYQHEFKDGRRTMHANFANAPITPAASIAVEIDPPDRDFFTLGAGVSAVFAGGFGCFVDYQPSLGLGRVENHGFAAGVRMEF